MADTTIFGEQVDVIVETDVLYMQLINILHRDKRFEDALDAGKLTDEARSAIADAFEETFERNRRLANIFLTDREAREQFIGFWFSRCYAEVQANAAYTAAFKRAAKIKGAAHA